jgi:hypothetical protein
MDRASQALEGAFTKLLPNLCIAWYTSTVSRTQQQRASCPAVHLSCCCNSSSLQNTLLAHSCLSSALSPPTGVSTILQDITHELQNAQSQAQYWKVEADAWKCRCVLQHTA